MDQAGPVRWSVADGVAVIRVANPPVNALSAAVRGGLVAAFRAVEADPAVGAAVLTGEGRTFIAGADITEFGKPPIPPSLPDTIAALDQATKPVVVAINGAALGGGMEIALGCHARVAAPGAVLGLPEVKLGLLPGSGGTQRLPRLIGGEAALKLIVEGRSVKAAEALSLGLVDEVAEGDLLHAATRRALAMAGQPPVRLRDRTDRLGSREAVDAAAAAILKRSGEMPNIAAAVEAVQAAFELPFDEGMALERAHFLRLLQDPRSKALRHVFFAERAINRIPALPKGTAARPVARVAVIGAGTMGGGIAMSFSNAGIPVTLIETGEEGLKRGLDRLAGNYDTSVKRGSLSAEARDERLARIEGRVGLEAAAEADLVVEAAFEEMGVKREIFGTLDRVARPGAVLASNTSYLDLDKIAAATSRPGDVVGMHFFSPANVMKLLEVVRGAQTSPEALATAVELGRKLGKVSVVVGNCHGFVGNRMLARRTVQAERLLVEGALPEDVDGALCEFGFRMGPFAMADLAGLDIGWSNRKGLGTAGDGKTAPVADALCEAGRFGQKTGRGFYDYSGGARQGAPDPAVRQLVEETSARLGVQRRTIGREEITERLLFPMINEGARILAEGIAARPGDIDVVWLNGYGWPAWTGGPMFHADAVGLPHVAARLEEFAARTGDETLRPAPLLAQLAREGRGFASLEDAAT